MNNNEKIKIEDILAQEKFINKMEKQIIKLNEELLQSNKKQVKKGLMAQLQYLDKTLEKAKNALQELKTNNPEGLIGFMSSF